MLDSSKIEKCFGSGKRLFCGDDARYILGFDEAIRMATDMLREGEYKSCAPLTYHIASFAPDQLEIASDNEFGRVPLGDLYRYSLGAIAVYRDYLQRTRISCYLNRNELEELKSVESDLKEAFAYHIKCIKLRQAKRMAQ